jgi:enamine deaminase RidA (YjgF/YER057c/UK114 family)
VIDRVEAAGLHPTSGYHHVTVVEAGRLAFLAGQLPVDDTGGRVVGVGDLDAQVDRTVHNAARALAVAGARPQDVVRSVVYVVASTPADEPHRDQHGDGAGATPGRSRVSRSAAGLRPLGPDTGWTIALPRSGH